MINPKSNIKSRRSFISKPKSNYKVWGELNPKNGSYTIFFGFPSGDVKTYAGYASSRATLDYNLRKAEVKFGLRSSEG